MEGCLKFEQVISRVKYGTNICVTDGFTKNELINKTWEHKDNVDDIEKEWPEADILGISVTNGRLS